MAQRFENQPRIHHGENAFVGPQKGKAAIPGHRTGRARSALAQLEQHTNKPEFPVGKTAKAQECIPRGDLVEGGAVKMSRPRAYSVEPMEADLTKLKGKPQQFVEVPDIDCSDIDKEYACAEYAKQISHYLKDRESVYQVPRHYIKSHQHINERMRSILVDWLVQVHDKFRLLQETLFLTVSFLDRYLAIDTKVQKCDLQLVGVTAMLLASKIEEIYTPEIRDFVYITDNAYSPSQIRACESKMTAVLEFNFGDPLCIHFLRRNSKAAKADAEKHTLAKYFMELMLPDYECLAFPPSQRAAASLCLAMKITDNSPWDATTAHYSHYQEPELVPCMKKVAQLVLKSKNYESKLLSVSKKYSSQKFFSIASSPCLTSKLVLTLAQQ
ncbi:G2/mitotic-specific cyclin-B-like [Dendronephthya gigantea]|uniref:G2/mitotic-specific cyclin-B-like n=1 Tax=Dendronephthya gigantea TaxID=151771 RepID=UPI00106A86B9|nr:G2/mitotic-specific cyclin-B-like [Dendronephthya gigantea]